MPTLHFHVDESGSFNFGSGGTDHFVFAAAWTYNPEKLASNLQELRYDLLRQGEDVQRFHAANDKRWQRDRVVETMAAYRRWKFAAVVIQKDRVYEQFRNRVKFYPKFLPSVLKFVFRGRIRRGTDRVLVYTDELPIKRKRKGVEKAIKQFCARELPDDLTWYVYHHGSASNAWLQVADYCAWSVFRKHERGDDSHYRRLKPRMAAPELVLWDE